MGGLRDVKTQAQVSEKAACVQASRITQQNKFLHFLNVEVSASRTSYRVPGICTGVFNRIFPQVPYVLFKKNSRFKIRTQGQQHHEVPAYLPTSVPGIPSVNS